MDKTIHINKQKVRIWPGKQLIEKRDGQVICSSYFQDYALYHPALIDWILSKNEDPEMVSYMFPGAGGKKIRNIHEWPLPEARLINARARELFRRYTGSSDAYTDSCWGNILDQGDYCLPHSHVRSQASIVYMLDAGDRNDHDSLAGKFSIIDPRINICCQNQAGRMTHPFIPEMPEGTMIIFPSELVHCVNPYQGTRPRMTLAWNINNFKIQQTHPREQTRQ